MLRKERIKKAAPTRKAHRMGLDGGSITYEQEILPPPRHSPTQVSERAHAMSNDELKAGFARLDRKDEHRKVFEVRFGFGGRGALMSYHEIAVALRRQKNKIYTGEDIRRLEAEAVQIVRRKSS